MIDLLRVYLDPDEIGKDGYPLAWHREGWAQLIEEGRALVGDEAADNSLALLGPERPSIKKYVRELAGFRCERCGHPYPPGTNESCPRGEWTPCDEQCTHGGPWGWHRADGTFEPVQATHTPEAIAVVGWLIETGRIERHASESAVILAQWRILTTHHLNGVKHDCRWWNLAALCQRCHLTIQGKVVMHREWNREHSEWFKPHAAGFYAAELLGEDLTREETMARLDELLDLQLTQHPLPGFS